MNAAERILAIYDKLVANGHAQHHMSQVWAEVLGIDGNLEDELIACQVALRAQIDAVKARMDEMTVPSELQDPGLARLKELASPKNNSYPWQNYRGNLIPPECRHGIRLAVWLLRDEFEEEMDAETMEALQRELAELEAAGSQPSISAYLRSFIQRQVDTIRSALHVYRVAGIQPVQKALRTVAGDLRVEQPQLEAELKSASQETKGVFSKLDTAVKKAAEVADRLDKIKKFGESAWAIGQAVAPYAAAVITYVATKAG
jgi:hypothetical protein